MRTYAAGSAHKEPGTRLSKHNMDRPPACHDGSSGYRSCPVRAPTTPSQDWPHEPVSPVSPAASPSSPRERTAPGDPAPAATQPTSRIQHPPSGSPHAAATLHGRHRDRLGRRRRRTFGPAVEPRRDHLFLHLLEFRRAGRHALGLHLLIGDLLRVRNMLFELILI